MNSTFLRTTEIDQILSAHHQLWDGAPVITFKDQTQSSYTPLHGGYHSVQLANAKGVAYLWITQNLHKPSYGTTAIEHATSRGETLRITWIVDTASGRFRYLGRIETHTYPDRSEHIHIETYRNDDVQVIYTTHPAYRNTSLS